MNLLQPQDRRAKVPGDTPEAVAARRRLHDAGVTAPLLEGIRRVLAPTAADVLLDIGCGEGFYLGSLQGQGYGVDLSTAAIEAAAKRYPACLWTIANADRFLPYADATFTMAMSITARRNVAEIHRVLQPGGRVLIGLPSPDDLLELRGRGRDRRPQVREEFATHFTFLEEQRVTTVAALDAQQAADVLKAIYRPLRPTAPQQIHVTLSLDLLLFRVL